MDNDGFFEVLFDLSFSKFLTSKIVPVLFVSLIILSGLAALAFPIGAYIAIHSQILFLVGMLIAVPVFLLLVILARLWLEFVVVFFKIADNTKMTAVKVGSAIQARNNSSMDLSDKSENDKATNPSLESGSVTPSPSVTPALAVEPDRQPNPTATNPEIDAPLTLNHNLSPAHIAVEADYNERIRDLMKFAVHPRHFELLDRLVSDLERHYLAKFGSQSHSEAWLKLVRDLASKRKACIENDFRARNEGSCLGCRGRLSPYEVSEQVCSKCKSRAVEFDRHIVSSS